MMTHEKGRIKAFERAVRELRPYPTRTVRALALAAVNDAQELVP